MAAQFSERIPPAAAMLMVLLALAPGSVWSESTMPPSAAAARVHAPAARAAAAARAPTQPHGFAQRATSSVSTRRGPVSNIAGAQAVKRAPPAAKTASRILPRHAVGPSMVGGPARYDAAKGAALGGTLMIHKR
jgi:hypothetical protein